MKWLSQHYQEKFGCKVYKLSLNAGLTCPNRDGTAGYGGCVFCTGSAEFAQGCDSSLEAQLEKAKARVAAKNPSGRYIAYFQSYTNTYAPVEQLERLFYPAIRPDYIVGLAIATRPDCLGPEVVALLQALNRIKPVSVELGLQTIHEESARYIRRGYATEVYYDAVARLRAAGLEVVTHIILGLPGETVAQMVATTRAAVQAGSNGIKFHLLHVMAGTDLAEDYAAGHFRCMTLEAYGAALKACAEVLPEDIVVHRITGDGAKQGLIAPLWSADKKRVLNYLHRLLGQ